MTQEEKSLLLKDLCARLPYDVIVRCYFVDGGGEEVLDTDDIADMLYNDEDSEFPMYKPYLRPLSSMTDEEKKEINTLLDIIKSSSNVTDETGRIIDCSHECIELIDFYVKYHFDYHGLIPMGLALEAPKDMYKN